MGVPNEPSPSMPVRLAGRLVRWAARLVPIEHREVFRETWLGELFHRSRDPSVCRSQTPSRVDWDLLFRSTGSFSHALWLRMKDWSLDMLLYEIYHGGRQWLQRPLLALVATATLAAGIGANTYIFGVVDGMLLRPFPYPEPEGLVVVGTGFPRQSPRQRFIEAVSVQDYLELSQSARSLTDFIAFDMGNRDLGGIDRPERLLTGAFWGDPFQTLRMPALLGRGFSEQELATQAPVAIISYRLWHRHFGGNQDVLSRTIVINGVPRTIVGVMPPRLLLLDTDLWVPMWYSADDVPRNRRLLTVMARSVGSTGNANAELTTIARRIEATQLEAFPEYEGWTLSASPLNDVWASFVGPAGTILLVAMGAILLIVCANLAALMLARASGRRQEMAIRSALGASGYRLAQQLLLETGWLAAIGGVAGLAIAGVGLRLTMAYFPEGAPLGAIELALNSHVVWYNIVVTLLGALLFGAAPALEAARTKAPSQIHSQRASTPVVSGFLFRRAIVVGQIALSLVLLSGASLLFVSQQRLSRIDPGLALEGVLSFRLTLPWERYEGRLQESFLGLVERLDGHPSIASAAVATEVSPLVRDDDVFTLEHSPSANENETTPRAAHTLVSPGWFRTMGVALEAGRLFSERDHADAPRVAVVNRALASRFFGERSPLNERLRLGREPETTEVTIVGVVSNFHNQGLDAEPAPQVFSSFEQAGRFANQAFVLLRARSDDDSAAQALVETARQQVRAMDPHLPIYFVSTMSERFGADNASRRILSTSMATIAICSVFLAMMGLYGVVSFLTQQHRREFGIRIAMGAHASQLIRWVLIRSAKLVGTGVGLGLVLSLLAGRSLDFILYEVAPHDPILLGITTAIIGGVALAASYLPARRAARLDPMESLRS